MDPYHGKQEKKPEPEAMDLPEELNLDQDEQAGQDEEGEGEGEGKCDEGTTCAAGFTDSIVHIPFKRIYQHFLIQCFSRAAAENSYDIDDKPMEVDEAEEEKGEEMMEGQQDAQGEDAAEEQKTEEEVGGEQTDGDKDSETDERGEEEEGKEEKEKGQADGQEEDRAVPTDQGQKPKVCTRFVVYLAKMFHFKSIVFRVRFIRMRSRTVRRKATPRWSLLRERSMQQMGRRVRRTFRATQPWSWQEPHPKETRPKRLVHLTFWFTRGKTLKLNSDLRTLLSLCFRNTGPGQLMPVRLRVTTPH